MDLYWWTSPSTQEQSRQKNTRSPTPSMVEAPASIDSQTEDSTIYVKGHDACQKLPHGSQQRTLRGRSVSQTLRTSPRRQSASKSVLKPIPNEVYVAYWPMSKTWFAVLIVPFEDIEKFGLSESIPACYDYNEHTGQVDWKRGYEDGGPLTVYREFPVIFFEETRDFDKGTLGWVAAKDIRDFDDNGSQASLIPNYDSVRTFIRNRHVPPADHEIQNDAQSNSALSSAGSATELSSERGLRSREPSAVRLSPEDQSANNETIGTENVSTAVEAMPSIQLDSTAHTHHELSVGRAQTAVATVTLPASFYLTQPTCVSGSDNSPTSYDLPPLNAETSTAHSLPNLRDILEPTSISPHRPPPMSTYPDIHADTTHRSVEPTIRSAITWPSLYKKRYTKQRNRPPTLPSLLGRHVGGTRSLGGQPRNGDFGGLGRGYNCRFYDKLHATLGVKASPRKATHRSGTVVTSNAGGEREWMGHFGGLGTGTI
ncbi:hypothetical protein NCS52_00874900 [Fusarium sp. LHS14.1]|nr:hypothetical protein NCS52_00874900 [Fusarium sp. LHS14.1]